MTATEIVTKCSAQGTPNPSGKKLQQEPNILQNGKSTWRNTEFADEFLQNGIPSPQSTEWIAGNSPLFSRSLQLEHKWNTTRTQMEHKWNTHRRSEHNWNTAGTPAAEVQVERKWNTSGTQMEHNWYMHHAWLRHLRIRSYKMEPADPSLQNGLLETHRYFPGASNWNTSGAKLEHNWNTSGTPTAEVNTAGTPAAEVQVGHKWNTTGTCITRDDAIWE